MIAPPDLALTGELNKGFACVPLPPFSLIINKDMSMQVYAIAIEKGGTGKSTLAVNLAAAFGRLNFHVLVIDLDAQGHASYWLGIAPASLRPEDSFLGLMNGRPLSECIRSTAEGVDVLPAHPALASLPVQLASTPNGGLFVLQD